MAEDIDISDLFCTENEDGTLFDEIEISPNWKTQYYQQDSLFSRTGTEFYMGFIVHDEESLKEMIERENELIHSGDYLQRLRSGELNVSLRKEGIDWISKAMAHHNFGPLCFCLSLNYLDRYLSLRVLHKVDWIMQLLAVACLSLAAKIEESQVPKCVDLQVGECKFVFEGKSIQKMELMVLSTLKWRMQAVTPCTFIEYMLRKIIDDQHFSKDIVIRSVRAMQNIIRVVDFLEFKPSEIAAAVAISVAREVQGVDIDKAINCFIQVEKERVMKCVEMIKGL